MVEEQLSISLGEDFAQPAPLEDINELGVALPMNGLQMGVMEVALLPCCTTECPLILIHEFDFAFGAFVILWRVFR